MSVVTLEQQTLAVLTELTDEEINGIVGGGYSADVAIGVKNGTNVKGTNVQIGQQTGIAIAIGEKPNASVDQKLTQKIYEGKKGNRK